MKPSSKQLLPLRQMWANYATGGVSWSLTRRIPPIPPSVLPLLLLLFALSTVFFFANDRSHFYRGVQHDHLSSQSIVLAANLSPKHHFLMFFRQALGAK